MATRKTDLLLVGNGHTWSPTFGAFDHGKEPYDMDDVDSKIERFYKARFSNVRFNHHELSVSYDTED